MRLKKLLYVLISFSYAIGLIGLQGENPISSNEFNSTEHEQFETPERKQPSLDLQEPLVAVFMVWNEEHSIESTLKSYIDGGITKFFIFDTGSTDNTIHVAQQYFKDRGITKAYIAQEFLSPLQDFAAARNRGLELATNYFYDTPFMLMPDADWYIHNVPELLQFCTEQANLLYPDHYMVRIMSNLDDFYTPRLIKTHNRVAQFAGEIHEVLVPALHERIPATIYFEWNPSSKSIDATSRRWRRDREVLKKVLEQRPDDTRALFYAAQTEEGLENLEESYRLYKRRSQLPGWPEEDYLTVYRLAAITERLANKNVPGYSWDEAQSYYLKAFALRSHRAEPLIRLAAHHWDTNQFALTFLYARRAVELSYPKHDTLSIEKQIYHYGRFEALSKSAWHVGECALGERATRHLINAGYEEAQLYRNLGAYIDCKNHRPTELWGHDCGTSK